MSRKWKETESEAVAVDESSASEVDITPREALPEQPIKPTPNEDDGPRFTVDRFATNLVAKHPAIVRAFVSVEKRVHGTRKLSAAAWQAAYDAFLTQER